MNPLSFDEQAHVGAFARKRDAWRVCVLGERINDESDASRSHKYAKTHPYITGMHFVMHYVSARAPCKLLDIGSPLAQNVGLSCLPGVDVTVLDVRANDDAEMLGLHWDHATATQLPYADASWDLVTSLWVMGHVGDGRYGDAFEVDGDLKMLGELARVLRPGGTLILGPGLIDTKCANIYNLHRIYSWEWLLKAFDEAGFEVVSCKELAVRDDVFIDGEGMPHRRDGVYGLSVLRKR